MKTLPVRKWVMKTYLLIAEKPNVHTVTVTVFYRNDSVVLFGISLLNSIFTNA